MKDEYDLTNVGEAQLPLLKKEIGQCEELLIKNHLFLTEVDLNRLNNSRGEALRRYGRLEFGTGILKKLVMEFSDSPYIYEDNLVETLEELQDAFYYFKTESMEEFSDDELIEYMVRYFNTRCQGSVEKLEGTLLEYICREIRAGNREAYSADEPDSEIDW